MQSKGERGRGGVGAHSGAVEEVSELGEVLATAKRRCPAAVDGEEGHHIVLGSSELA